MDDSVGTRLACPEEWLHEGELQDDTVPVAFMASQVSKQPSRVAQIGRRILSYLKATQSLKLVMGVDATNSVDPSVILRSYSDTSFSSYGEKSYGASVVRYHGNSPSKRL